jgi:hypothetical protein
MRSHSESERIVLCSERIVLECKCGERLILLGREDDWYSEGRAVFECHCGDKLTLAHRFYEEETNLVDGFGEGATGVRELLRNLRSPGA